MLTACERVMRDLCAEMGCELREFNGENDHVHLLVHYLRKEFTGHVNRHFMHDHLWSPSYFAASAGGAPLAIIKQYIGQQKRPA